VIEPARADDEGRPTDTATILRPYVPRLVIDWLRTTPTATHREIEGTLVFVDISGFTALSERLAKRGKVGAELMRDTLDGVFTALLDEAYDWGAGLLKWGGDALLLMFDGPSHEERAARAAWEMQRTIGRVGRLHVPGGTIVLRMSVGIASGPIHFFMTGSVHRELLVAGPMVTETLVMEGIADAEEIGLSPALAARLDPSCVGPSKLAARLLVAPPEVDRIRAPDVGDISGLDIASCIPIAAREHVLLRRTEPEHRTITAAFIDMMGTDALLADLGPDRLAEALDERIRSIEEAALRYEVPFYESDVGKSSVKALLTAGAPSSTGHDEERMLRALREIIEAPGLVPLRIGVNTGKVFTGDFGPPYRRAYRVFGDAINTAARVMAKAEAGQILSTQIVLDRSRTVFETTPIEPFAAKGKSEPVRASIVGPATGVRATEQGSKTLVGRDEERAAMLAAIDRAREGRATIVEISGEPGMGKTHLVAEVAAQAADFRLVRSRCEEYEASTPYFALRAIVRSALDLDEDADTEAVVAQLDAAIGEVDAGLMAWRPLLGILLGLDLPDTPETAALGERFIRERLAEVALPFLGTLFGGVPTIFLVEDVHHLDDASHDLLLRLARAAKDRMQVLIVTRQGTGEPFALPGPGMPDLVSFDLGPLPIERLIEVIDAATEDRPLARHEVEEIARRSGGNALFLFELLEAVRATGSLESLPDSVEAMIAGEIDRLRPTDRTILRYAAVLGTSVDPDLLAQAVGSEAELDADVWRRLDGLLIREPSGGLRFRNALIRDAAYEGLPYRRRRVLHGRVAETIEANAGSSLDEELGALAIHYWEAERWEKAWTYCREAGDRAAAIYANVEATKAYERALVAGRRRRDVSRSDLAAIHERIGDLRYDMGEPDRADRQFEAARRLVGHDLAAQSRLALKQAKQTTTQGRHRVALGRVTRAIHALDGVRGREAAAGRARLYVWYGWIRASQDRPAEAIRWYRRGSTEAKRSGADDALAQAYQAMDSAYFDLGQLDRTTHTPEALAIYERLGDLDRQALALNNMGVYRKELSRWSESRAMYDRARELFEKVGDRAYEALTKYNIAEILSDQGHYDDAERLLRDVIRSWRAAGAETDVAEAWRDLARVLARRGDLAGARQLLDDARAVQVDHDLVGELLTTDSRIAEVLVLSGEGEAALELVDDVGARAQSTDAGPILGPTICRLRGWALMQLGRIDEARAAFDDSRNQTIRRGDEYQLALALEGLAAVARATGDDARALETERRSILERLGIETTPAVPLGAAGVVD